MAKPQPLADEGQQRGGCCKEWQWRASEEEKYFPTQTSASRAGQAGGGGGHHPEAFIIRQLVLARHKPPKTPRFCMLLVHVAQSQPEKVKS